MATASTTIASARHQNRRTIRRGLVEEKEDGMSSMLDTNNHKGTGNTGNTDGSSDEPDTDVCNSELVNYVGLWEAIDESDGRNAINVKASIKCFKNECGCKITYVGDNRPLVTQDYSFDPESDALEDVLGPNEFILSDDGSLEFSEFFGVRLTFWRVSQSVDTLPRRPPPPPAVFARDDFISVPARFSGSKDINVLDNDTTRPEGVELKVARITSQPTNPSDGYCSISHDDDKVVDYIRVPSSKPFRGAECEYEACTVPDGTNPVVCGRAKVTIGIDSETQFPTLSPTLNPTLSPSISPTLSPTLSPTFLPTVLPTITPTNLPTLTPTKLPTQE